VAAWAGIALGVSGGLTPGTVVPRGSMGKDGLLRLKAVKIDIYRIYLRITEEALQLSLFN